MSLPSFIHNMNMLAKSKTPFLFIIDYRANKAIIKKLDAINPEEILFSINGISNYHQQQIEDRAIRFQKSPISLDAYNNGFKIVKEHLKKGNSYLCNYTCQTAIDTNLSLKDIFYKSKAPYKLYFNDEFVVFSPEIFVKIIDGRIFSYPMKGTIDADIENAAQLIMANKKEAAEHATIVDLIRNDLSRVATNVKVDKYRYIDKIETNQKNLLQVSSEISGDLPDNYKNNIGNIIYELLPAGSISGAPKQKTLEIIEEAENYNRGFYTGIMGVFDGNNIDAGVMIRFVEKINNKLYFKSGGGITVNSNLQNEYEEMINKVYLPFN